MTRDDIIAFILKEEGGLVDNPNDSGGRTNFGITQRYLDGARSVHPDMNLPTTVDDLTSEQAAELYRRDQWSQIHGDALPIGLALLVMDTAVNSGVSRAVKILQTTVGVTADGVMGSNTLLAAQIAETRGLVVDEYCAQHAVFYARLDGREDQFELGWMRRLIAAHRIVCKES